MRSSDKPTVPSSDLFVSWIQNFKKENQRKPLQKLCIITVTEKEKRHHQAVSMPLGGQHLRFGLDMVNS